MNTITTLFGFAGVTAAFVLVVPIALGKIDRWRHDRTDGVEKWFHDENMPAELRKATLYMNEQAISLQSPVRLNGQVDQVYRKRNGLLVLVDTKTRSRHRVYDSDIYQLSLYALILSIGRKEKVSGKAYVRTVIRTPTSRIVRYHKVRLIPSAALIRQLS